MSTSAHVTSAPAQEKDYRPDVGQRPKSRTAPNKTVGAAADGRAGRARAGVGQPGAPDTAHEWVSFEDPDEDRTWLFDVTFLTSRWTCIYGCGCQGVLTGPAPEREEGCCSYGAHFSGAEDVARGTAAAARLSDAQWQHRAVARARGGPITRNRSGDTVTRMVGGACIFLNRSGFAGGAGCALHRAALEQGVAPLELKPDVCWQLPLRREDSEADNGHVTSTVLQWDRRHWGAGGAEFHWWCTESPEPFVGREPVYLSMADELLALVGERPYRMLCEYLGGTDATTQRLPHPAVRSRDHQRGTVASPSSSSSSSARHHDACSSSGPAPHSGQRFSTGSRARFRLRASSKRR